MWRRRHGPSPAGAPRRPMSKPPPGSRRALGARATGAGSRSRGVAGVGAAAIAGGATVIWGTWLSWFSLFAGLQPYRGVDVLNGRLLAAGGLLSIVAGAWFWVSGDRRLRWGIGLLGFALLAFASWSGLQVRIIYRALAADPLLVARQGPGLVVAVIGALAIFATLFVAAD